MGNQETKAAREEMKLVVQEIKENPYQKFEIAFALMSIIPFLVFVYLLATRLFTVEVLIGDIGLVLFISITLSMCGFFIGYNIIRRTLNKVVFYAAQAKHSDQLKSKFVATASHDLRNPLFVLDANVSDLNGGAFGDVNEKQKSVLELCHGVVKRMTQLVENLLDIYKVEAGIVKLKKEKCDIPGIIGEQIAEMKVMVDKKNLNLTTDFQKGADLSILADISKIVQVVNNILGNAIKFTPGGGKIDVKVFSTDGLVRLECKDTAEAIPSQDLHKIFDKFERLDTAKKGSGLGLAIAKDIIEFHKGKIWAESQPGQGNTFVVILPRGAE
ncbi:MAG: HAMP domain-containing sensor histidine kinase [Candidatus Omnitrophota bacterium]